GTPHTTFNTTTTGPLGSQSHTYGEEGTKAVTVKVTDTGDGQAGSATFNVSVSDPAVLQGPAVPVSAVEGTALPGPPLTTFPAPGGPEPTPSDPNDGLASHYKVVSTNWRDGTPLDTTTGAITYNGTPGSTTDPFTVTGSHTYEREGSYTVTVVID